MRLACINITEQRKDREVSIKPTIYIHQLIPFNLRKTKKLPLHRSLRLHNPPPKKLTHNPKPIPRPPQLPSKQLMLLCSLDLPLPNSAKSVIRSGARGTLRVFVDAVQTALMEGVLAEEVDDGEVEGSGAGVAAAGLEDGRLGGEGLEFGLFCGCFGFVA